VAAHAAERDPTAGLSAQEITSLYRRDGGAVRRDDMDVPLLLPYDVVRRQAVDGDGAVIDALSTAVAHAYGNGMDLTHYDQAWRTASALE
jgi:hypothetical protein